MLIEGNARILVTKYDSDVLGHILGGMTDEVSTVESPSDTKP